MSTLKRSVIDSMGFLDVGINVSISSRASFYNCSNISIGDNVRIDDFCILSAGSGGIKISNHVHVGVYSSLIGKGRIILSPFCNISSRVSIYSSNDDYSGKTMTNPMVPTEYKNVKHGDVFIGKHVIIGSGSILLPGVTLEDGVAIGALSLVSMDCQSFGIYGGVPAKFIRERKRDILDLEKQYLGQVIQK